MLFSIGVGLMALGFATKGTTELYKNSNFGKTKSSLINLFSGGFKTISFTKTKTMVKNVILYKGNFEYLNLFVTKTSSFLWFQLKNNESDKILEARLKLPENILEELDIKDKYTSFFLKESIKKPMFSFFHYFATYDFENRSQNEEIYSLKEKKFFTSTYNNLKNNEISKDEKGRTKVQLPGIFEELGLPDFLKSPQSINDGSFIKEETLPITVSDYINKIDDKELKELLFELEQMYLNKLPNLQSIDLAEIHLIETIFTKDLPVLLKSYYEANDINKDKFNKPIRETIELIHIYLNSVEQQILKTEEHRIERSLMTIKNRLKDNAK